MKWTRRSAIGFVLAAILVNVGAAENWPQWRGPFFNGTTSETHLPASLGKENFEWSAPLSGPSGATPIIWADRVFLSSTDANTKQLLALCLDARDGKVLWRKPMGTNTVVFNNDMASPSPVTDGNTVFFYYGTGRLGAFDFEGKPLWSREIEKDYGNFSIQFGYASSPLLHGGRLYIPILRRPRTYRGAPAGGPLDSLLLALEPRTGKELWKHVRATDAQDEAFESYATPIPHEADGRTEIIVAGGDYLTAHDPHDGKELWRYGYNPGKNKYWRLVPTPATGEGLIVASTPRNAGPAFAVRLGGSGLLGGDRKAWATEEIAPDVCCSSYYQGFFYLLDGNKKVLSCRDPKTGKPRWQGSLAVEGDAATVSPLINRPTPGGDPVFRASPTVADGKIYCIDERGNVVVAAAGDAFKVLARIALGEGPCRSSIAIAGGKLFLRTARNLHCLSAGGKKGGEAPGPNR